VLEHVVTLLFLFNQLVPNLGRICSRGKMLGSGLTQFFEKKSWGLRAHQRAALEAARSQKHALIVAPTGAGKTLAGFLPVLNRLDHEKPVHKSGPSCLYITPLKVLAGDIARNLEAPAQSLMRRIDIGLRTGDTPQHERARQWESPPDILILTPEQLALMLSHPRSVDYFAHVQDVIIDEIHAIAPGKRGDLLSLDLARLKMLGHPRFVGLSATIHDRARIAQWMVAQEKVEVIEGPQSAPPQLEILIPNERIPWSGHGAGHVIKDILHTISEHRLTLCFVNTRSGAEALFAQLWLENETSLPIALHHGSLARAQRLKVEQAIGAGLVRAVVATSTLDLGVDWGDVDLVIQIGAPKGSGRLMQRIGRANHQLDTPSKAWLVPSNRFEYLECLGAKAAVGEGAVDPVLMQPGHLDVLCQHIMGMSCAAPFAPDDLYHEVCTAGPYQRLTREDFDACLKFVVRGGTSLKSYEDLQRLSLVDGRYMVAASRFRRAYRAQVGTITDTPMMEVAPARFVAGRWKAHGATIGELEEWFAQSLRPGDAFILGGRAWAVAAHDGRNLLVHEARGEAVIPSFQGGKFPLSTHLAARVRAMIADPSSYPLDEQVMSWLKLQAQHSYLPKEHEVLLETFARGKRHYLVAYCFEGRLAHQSLGMLLTRRLDRAGVMPLGFVANEYALAVWSGKSMSHVNMDALFHEDMLGDDLEEWFQESAVVRRAFGYCGKIAGLFPRGQGMNQVSRFSPNLVFDVLQQYEPDHVLLRAAYRDAAEEVLDLPRLQDALMGMKGEIVHRQLDRISPLSVPLMLEAGRESVHSQSHEELLDELTQMLPGIMM